MSPVASEETSQRREHKLKLEECEDICQGGESTPGGGNSVYKNMKAWESTSDPGKGKELSMAVEKAGQTLAMKSGTKSQNAFYTIVRRLDFT